MDFLGGSPKPSRSDQLERIADDILQAYFGTASDRENRRWSDEIARDLKYLLQIADWRVIDEIVGKCPRWSSWHNDFFTEVLKPLAEALREQNDPRVVQSAARIFRADEDQAKIAAEFLVYIGSEEAQTVFVAALSQGTKPLRQLAAESLSRLQWVPRSPESRAAHAVALEKWSEVAAVGTAAVPILLESVEQSNSPDREIKTLCQIGDASAAPRLLARLEALLRSGASAGNPDVFAVGILRLRHDKSIDGLLALMDEYGCGRFCNRYAGSHVVEPLVFRAGGKAAGVLIEIASGGWGARSAVEGLARLVQRCPEEISDEHIEQLTQLTGIDDRFIDEAINEQTERAGYSYDSERQPVDTSALNQLAVAEQETREAEQREREIARQSGSSSRAIDPYVEILKLDPADCPPDYYTLLGLARFTSDIKLIEKTAAERIRFVRPYCARFPTEGTQLLNELTKAKLCLLDDEERASYDATLRSRRDA